MINKILGELEKHTDRTAAQIAHSISGERQPVSKILNQLVASGKAIKEQQPVGYYTYSLNQDYKEMADKKIRNKPFTPNQIAGAYIAKGNVVIKLTRRACSRSVTLSGDDLDMISTLYKGVKNTHKESK